MSAAASGTGLTADTLPSEASAAGKVHSRSSLSIIRGDSGTLAGPCAGASDSTEGTTAGVGSSAIAEANKGGTAALLLGEPAMGLSGTVLGTEDELSMSERARGESESVRRWL